MQIVKAVLTQCSDLGFNEVGLTSELKARETTRGTVAYYLLLTSRTKINKSDYLQRSLCETTQVQLQHPAGIMWSGDDDPSGCAPSAHKNELSQGISGCFSPCAV